MNPSTTPPSDEQDRQGQPQGRREREQRADRDQEPEELEILMRAEVHRRELI